jgi:hypothetical protein
MSLLHPQLIEKERWTAAEIARFSIVQILFSARSYGLPHSISLTRVWPFSLLTVSETASEKF